MIPPALLIIGFGEQRRVRLPLPVFLLWPLILLGWICVAVAWPFTRGPGRAKVGGMLVALRCAHALRGLRIDIQGEDTNIYLSLI